VPVVAAALALTACSSDEPADAGSPPVATAGAGPTVYGPIQDTRQAGYDYVTAQSAINRQLDAVWSRCMKATGYDLPPPSPSREQILTDGFHIAYGTDIANPEVRAKEGYGVTSKLVGIPSVYNRENAVSQRVKTMSEAERNGFDEILNACSDQAHTEVLPTVELTELDDASQEIGAELAGDQRVLAARAAWGACMQAAGFPYRGPDSVADAIDAKAKPLYQAAKPGVVTPQAQALHAEELRTAAADWTCRKSTINPAWTAVRNELEGKFLKEHAELADRVWARMTAVITKGAS
jgi:hypothetical protein